MEPDFKLSPTILVNRRRLFKRSEIEHLKQKMFAKAAGHEPPEYSPPEIETFVNATDAA